MEKGNIKILYLDEEIYNLIAFKAHFRQNTLYDICVCQSEEDGFDLLRNNKYHIVILSQRRANKHVVEVLECIKKCDPDVLRIVVSGYNDLRNIECVKNEGGIFDFLPKPLDLDELERSFLKAFALYKECNKSKG